MPGEPREKRRCTGELQVFSVRGGSPSLRSTGAFPAVDGGDCSAQRVPALNHQGGASAYVESGVRRGLNALSMRAGQRVVARTALMAAPQGAQPAAATPASPRQRRRDGHEQLILWQWLHWRG